MDGQAPPSAPSGYPVVGHALACLRGPLSALERWGRADEDVLRVRIGRRPFCLVTDPAAVGRVLATDAGSFRKADLVRDRLGTLQSGSLVLLEGEDWRERRQRLQAAVTEDRTDAAGAITTQYADAMLADWPADGRIDVEADARHCSLSILAAALFDLDVWDDRTPIHDAADDVLARMDLRSVSAYLPEWVPTPTNRRYRRAVETLHDELDELIAARTDADWDGAAPNGTTSDGTGQNGTGSDGAGPDGTAPDGVTSDGTGPARTAPNGTDVPALLARAGLPAETIRNELIAFLFAGYDSTATALSCTLGLLGDHSEVQADLRAELDRLPDERAPRPADLPDLSLLEAVVRESLRLYPPQYLLFREPTTTVTLGGYRIEPGTTLLLPPWVLHRDPRWWDDPETFYPERWLGDGPDRPDHAYLPYGGGPRHCLGRRMADQTLRLVTAMACRRRRLELVGSLSVSAGPTLAIDDGLELRATPVR